MPTQLIKQCTTTLCCSTRSKGTKPVLLVSRILRTIAALGLEFVSSTENVLLMRFNSCPFSYAVAWNSFQFLHLFGGKKSLMKRKAACLPWQRERRNPLCNCSSHRRIFFHIVAGQLVPLPVFIMCMGIEWNDVNRSLHNRRRFHYDETFREWSHFCFASRSSSRSCKMSILWFPTI